MPRKSKSISARLAQWKSKAKARRYENKKQKIKIARLEKSRDYWRSKYESYVQLMDQPSQTDAIDEQKKKGP